MTFTMSALARSLADCLSPELPGASFYEIGRASCRERV